jgi:hypothetical protein
MMQISYTKIDGDWCLRIPASMTEGLSRGQEVTVTKRDGSTKTEILGDAISIQETHTIALIATPRARAPEKNRGRRDYEQRRNGDRIYRGEANRTYHRDGTVTHRGPNGRTWTEY